MLYLTTKLKLVEDYSKWIKSRKKALVFSKFQWHCCSFWLGNDRMAECQLIGSSGSGCFTFCSLENMPSGIHLRYTLSVCSFFLSAGIWLNPIMNLRFIKSWDRKSKDEKYNKRKGRCHFAVVVAVVVNIMLFWAIYRLDIRYHMADILLLYSLRFRTVNHRALNRVVG